MCVYRYIYEYTSVTQLRTAEQTDPPVMPLGKHFYACFAQQRLKLITSLPYSGLKYVFFYGNKINVLEGPNQSLLMLTENHCKELKIRVMAMRESWWMGVKNVSGCKPFVSVSIN